MSRKVIGASSMVVRPESPKASPHTTGETRLWRTPTRRAATPSSEMARMARPRRVRRRMK